MIIRNENVNELEVENELRKHSLLEQKKHSPEKMLANRKKDLKYFKKAEHSYFYNKTSFEYSKINNWDDLLQAPTWNYDYLENAVKKAGWERILIKKPREWISTTGRTRHKWMPWGDKGIQLAHQNGVYQIINGGLKSYDKVLALPAPSPFATGRFVEFLHNAIRIELLPGSLTTTPVMLELALKRGFDAGVSAPALWLRIAEQFAEKASEKNVLTKTISKVKTLYPKIKFNPRTFLCGGTTTTESMQKRMIETWGAPIINILASTEAFFMGAGCYEDTLNGETSYTGPTILAIKNKKETKFVHQCKKGEEGELIVYRIDDSFPLIGYETGDIVTLVQEDECACGNKTPKIRFKSRKGNDPIDVNSAKIWQDHFTDLMSEIKGIKNWELTADHDEKINKTKLILKYESHKPWQELEEKILQRIRTHPSTSEFVFQADSFFENFKDAITIQKVEDELTKNFENSIKNGVYKPEQFNFTKRYVNK